jgi:hypothetical protein
MQVIKTKVFTLEELDDSAKETARQWWREHMGTEDYADSVIDDAGRVAELFGIEFKTRDVKLYGGGTRPDPCVWWSGFSSQGDGASFEGWFKPRGGNLARLTEYAPQDEVLKEIAIDLDRIASLAEEKCVSCRITTSDSYSHSHSMDFELSADDDDLPEEAFGKMEDAIPPVMRCFADWIYRQLEAEYEYQSSDEQVDEMLIANGYTFTSEGKRFG